MRVETRQSPFPYGPLQVVEGLPKNLTMGLRLKLKKTTPKHIRIGLAQFSQQGI